MPKPANPQPVPVPVALHALQAARAAMDEWKRLDALRTSLPASLAAAERYRDECADAVKAAEADAILAGGMANRNGAAEARGKLDQAEGSVTSLRHAIEGVGPKLAAADAALADAIPPAREAMTAHRRAAVRSYADDLASAVAGLAAVLQRGHALAAAGAGVSREHHLGTMLIPATFYGGSPLLAGGMLLPGTDKAENVAATWPDSPEAAAIHAELRPLLTLQVAIDGHAERQRRQAEDAWMADIRRRQADTSYRPQNNRTPRPPEPEYVPPKGAGPLRSWSLPISPPPPVPGA